jgi:iron complex transport system ATP-binding protein
MNARLEGHDVSVVRGGRRILESASVVVAPGTLTAVVGPNGSGKSTLLRVLAGLWAPASGSVTLNGQPIGAMPRREMARRLAFLPQDTRCDFAFTVQELVAMGRHPHRGRFQPEGAGDRHAIEAAIAMCDLEDLRQRTVDRLSGGERQRVAIARCLATEPEAILLDEPTAHLDLEHALSIVALCRSLADAGRTVALATHDLGTVVRYATHVLVLHNGRVAGFGTPSGVLTPEMCRKVFSVDTEILTTAHGSRAFVFSSSDTQITKSPDHQITKFE